MARISYSLRLIFILILFCNYTIATNAQSFHAKMYFGAMYYQGDLAPRPIDISFGPGNLSYGFSVGYDVTDFLSLNSRYMVGRLSGDDKYADDKGRRERNLSFASPLYEYGLYSDFRINKLWTSLDKYKLRLYLSLGLNYFNFDPHAFYNGEWIALQPLGTEGQKLPIPTKGPYKLSGLSRAIGLILEFDFSKRIAFGMEVSPRKTYTDYLDDVSGNYVSYGELVASGNELGATLANRAGEYKGIGPVMLPTGAGRGNPKNNDWYTYIGVYFKVNIGKSIQVVIPSSTIGEEALPAKIPENK